MAQKDPHQATHNCRPGRSAVPTEIPGKRRRPAASFNTCLGHDKQVFYKITIRVTVRLTVGSGKSFQDLRL